MFETDNVDAFTMSFYFAMLKNQENQIEEPPTKETKVISPTQKVLTPTPIPELWY